MYRFLPNELWFGWLGFLEGFDDSRSPRGEFVIREKATGRVFGNAREQDGDVGLYGELFVGPGGM